MATLADLQVKLDMESAKFRTELEKVGKSVGSLERRVVQSSNTIDTAFKFTAAAVAARALYGFVKAGADASDQTKNFAAAVGLSVSELSKLEYAAKQSGGGTEELQAGLRELSKNMAEAAAGSKDAEAKFAAIGVRATDSSGQLRSVGSVLEEIADRFAGYKDGAGKAALAQELLGRSGTRLVGTLNNGKQGLRDLGDQATKTGRVLTNDVARGASLFNDTLEDIRVRAEIAGATLASRLAPALQVVVKHFDDASQRTRAFSTALDYAEGFGVVFGQTFVLVSSIAEAAGIQVKGLFNIISAGAQDGLSGASAAFKKVQEELKQVAAAYEKSVNDFYKPRPSVKPPSADKKTETPVVRKAKETKKELNASIKELAHLEEEWNRQLETFGLNDAEKLAHAFENDSKLRKAMADVFKDPVARKAFQDEGIAKTREFVEATKAIDQVEKQHLKTVAAIIAHEEERKDAVEEAKRATEEMLTPIQRYRKELEEVERKVVKNKLSEEQANALRKKAFRNTGLEEEAKAAREEQLDDIERYLAKIKEVDQFEVDAQKNAVDTAALRHKAWRQAFGDLSDFGRKGASLVEGVFDSFASNISEGFDSAMAAVQKTFTQALLRMLAEAAATNLTKALFGDAKNEGLLSIAFAALKGGASSKRAAGGPVGKGRSYLVGEEGPELFSPTAAGSILPADQTAALITRGGVQRVELVLPAQMAHMTVRDLIERQYAGMMARR